MPEIPPPRANNQAHLVTTLSACAFCFNRRELFLFLLSRCPPLSHSLWPPLPPAETRSLHPFACCRQTPATRLQEASPDLRISPRSLQPSRRPQLRVCSAFVPSVFVPPRIGRGEGRGPGFPRPPGPACARTRRLLPRLCPSARASVRARLCALPTSAAAPSAG